MAKGLLALVVLCAVGCGGLGVPKVPSVTNGVSPQSVTINPGQQVQFTFVHDGVPVDNVVWDCNAGSITDHGKYTAPDSAGIYQVTAVHDGSNGDATIVVG